MVAPSVALVVALTQTGASVSACHWPLPGNVIATVEHAILPAPTTLAMVICSDVLPMDVLTSTNYS